MDSETLCTRIEQFHSEDRCRAYLEALRWTGEIVCPRCNSRKISPIVKRNKYDCASCRYQFSVTAGTVFNDSHLPLWKWFLCTYLLCESEKGMSANQLSRTLGISYRTAWYLCHRIRSAMREASPGPSKRIVEIDELHLDSKRHHGNDAKRRSLKYGISGSRHKVSAKHLPAYLDEAAFRINNRDNPFLFRDTMLKLLEAPVLEYKKLTAA
jgi:transposase-like protein